MSRMSMIEAIRSAMDVSMARNDNVVVFGEDVGYFGGVFRCTQGLQQKYGKSRCFDAPISELGIVGAAIGMAAYGLRPCVEVQFADYVYPAYDQIVSEAARLRYRSNGEFTCPLVIRMPTGGGIFGGQTHSQSPEALFTHVSGLKTVVPSNPYDAKGLLIAAIEDPDPVIFLEPKRLYNGPFDGHHDRPVTSWAKHDLGEVPDDHYIVPLGKAVIRRAGAALTILAYGTMVYVAEAAVAVELAEVPAHELDVVGGLRAQRVAGDADGLPGGERGVGLLEEALAGFLQRRDVAGELLGLGVLAQGVDLLLDLEDRLLEVEHVGRAVAGAWHGRPV